MRKLIILSIGLLATLMIGCNEKNENTAENDVAKGISEHDGALTGAIAYVNIDSLVAHYDLAIDLNAQYTEKAQKIDAELTSKGRSLENAIASYQEKVQKVLITRADATKEEERLTKQQQDLLSYRDKVLQDLSEEEAVMTNRIYYGITDYIQEYNADGKYDVIFTTSSTGPIISAKAALNITDEILKGINAKYASEKKNNSAQ